MREALQIHKLPCVWKPEEQERKVQQYAACDAASKAKVCIENARRKVWLHCGHSRFACACVHEPQGDVQGASEDALALYLRLPVFVSNSFSLSLSLSLSCVRCACVVRALCGRYARCARVVGALCVR